MALCLLSLVLAFMMPPIASLSVFVTQWFHDDSCSNLIGEMPRALDECEVDDAGSSPRSSKYEMITSSWYEKKTYANLDCSSPYISQGGYSLDGCQTTSDATFVGMAAKSKKHIVADRNAQVVRYNQYSDSTCSTKASFNKSSLWNTTLSTQNCRDMSSVSDPSLAGAKGAQLQCCGTSLAWRLFATTVCSGAASGTFERGCVKSGPTDHYVLWQEEAAAKGAVSCSNGPTCTNAKTGSDNAMRMSASGVALMILAIAMQGVAA